MAVAVIADMDSRAPRSGETVSLLGYGIAAQEAVVEVCDGSRLLLRARSPEGFAVGTALEAQYQRDGELHCARGKLESRTGNMWWLTVEDVQRVQRRQHVRVTVTHKATLLIANPSGGEDAFLVDLVDVSAGGCAFLYDGQITEGTRVELRFRVNDGRIHVRAIVLECRPTPRGQFRVRGRFVDLPSGDEERLAEWVLAQTHGRALH
jgi:hypothetical protein